MRKVLLVGALLWLCASAQAYELPQMRSNVAEAYMDYALGKRFGDNYTQAADVKLSCHKRHSRVRMGCRIGWAIGDFYYYGKGRIWYSQGRHGNVLWNYGWEITRLNDYCLRVEHLPESECAKHYEVD